ncbi:MAG TPA: hypothetical protein VN031_03390 [Candidatus Microsaccharimonas sp.]|nr:hypothetical protein [Candidatus Microsaccharimonas sp.]
MKKLNMKGFGHIELMVAVVAVLVIGGTGAKLLSASHADSTTNASAVCGSGFTKVAAHSMYDFTHDGAYGKTGPGLLEFYVNYSTHQVCGFVFSTSPAYGVGKSMHIAVTNIYKSGTTFRNAVAQQTGTFKYFVGPAKLTDTQYTLGSNGVSLYGYFYYGGHKYEQSQYFAVSKSFGFTSYGVSLP